MTWFVESLSAFHSKSALIEKQKREREMQEKQLEEEKAKKKCVIEDTFCMPASF